MHIAVFSATNGVIDAFKENFPNEKLSLFPDSITDDDLTAIADADIICLNTDSDLKSDRLSITTNLKLIATRSTGYDHIDLAYCKEHGISVVTVPAYGEKPVAEFTFALMLALTRKITLAHDATRKRESTDTTHFEGVNLFGKTLGVVGTGKIGAAVVHIAKGFRMNVVAYDPYPKEELAKSEGFVYTTLEDLLMQSDIVTLHVPYMSATHHLLNAEKLAQMKKGAYIINTARGGLIDTNALLDALRDGRIGGAALDVLEGEHDLDDEFSLINSNAGMERLNTVIQDHVLIGLNNVIVTPHIAFNSHEAVQEILDTSIDNIRSFIMGVPKNVVNK